METHKGLEVLTFPDYEAWLSWLAERHTQTESVWLKLAKKKCPDRTVTYEEGREGALRYGWIDGLINRLDEHYYLIKFTPRRPRSKWSKINRDIAEQLIEEGLMTPTGLAQVEAARKDGRWEAAYSSQKDMKVPDDFQTLLDEHPKASEFWTQLTRAQQFSVLYHIEDAKREATRERRKQKYLTMLLEERKP